MAIPDGDPAVTATEGAVVGAPVQGLRKAR
jgi:hypothetical protein